MGDGLKISKEKRHRSSSSIAGTPVETTRSERKLEINDYIPESDDQFAVAEIRCKELEDKLDILKNIKRKKKIKKRSMTKIVEQPSTPDNVITVRTQPKKKVLQQSARLRRLEVPQNPTRGYLDPATVEQHRMIGQVRGYNHAFKQPQSLRNTGSKTPVITEDKLFTKQRNRQQRSQADGDSACSNSIILVNERLNEVACGQDYSYADNNHKYEDFNQAMEMKLEEPRRTKTPPRRQRHLPKEVPFKEDESNNLWRNSGVRRRGPSKQTTQVPEERPLVELFTKNYAQNDFQRQNTDIIEPAQPIKPKKVRNSRTLEDLTSDRMLKQNTHSTKKGSHVRRKYRSHGYELPTVASQMKQAGMRYYYETGNRTNIPFVVSKSTAPSHNIGVNIQQVLNGLKIQQPLSGIPPTIAHHMGLSHVPMCHTKNTPITPVLDNRLINSIRVGQRLVRLPSYKYMSYNRLLSMYREGDGMVPRFLRAISRPHYFYTSMYNLTTNHEDFDGATSKGRASSQIAKQNLTEFANLYREYNRINKCIKEGKGDPALQQRKEELSRELVAREQQICRVVNDYRTDNDQILRASASAAEDYRHSSFKLDQ